ncbi:MAG: alpha-galactosidase [Lachnospiraceae bacterium]|nr:alpha-galactosidase [Lachnospiraceae bacterium]
MGADLVLKWCVNGRVGSQKMHEGTNCVIVPVTEGEVLRTVEARLAIEASRKMYFNGYQSWTYSPEYTPYGRIRGLRGTPKLGIDKFSLDRYGDYHFVDYPWHRGILHGVSYCYFRDGDRYRLLASLDEKTGYTLFTYNSTKAVMKIERDCKGVAVHGATVDAFDLFYAEGTETEVFDRWFEAMGVKNAVPPIKGYSSWYNHYQDINEQGILEDLTGAIKVFDDNDLFQIDDGWEPFVGDWDRTDPVKFPNGLAPLAEEIHMAGLRAGLWLAPFVCEEKSDIFKNHPDWLLQYKGEPWKAGCNWSGFYALDIDNPEVREHLRRIFRRIFDEWNFDLVKLDFLYAAAPYATGDHGTDGDGAFKESRAGRMIRALTFLREICGSKLILGCGTPVMPAFGLVDYCRIGCDVGLDWNDKMYMRIIHRERVSTKQSINNTIFRRGLDRRAHGNDPDVFFLRDNNISLTPAEKNYLTTVNALFGTVWLTSDDLNSYDGAKIAQYRALVHMREAATDVSIDHDTLAVSYTLDGKRHTVEYPHRYKVK